MRKHWLRLLAALVACLLLMAGALAEESQPADEELLAAAVEAAVEEEEFDLGASEEVELGSVLAPGDCAHEYTYTDYDYDYVYTAIDNREHTYAVYETELQICQICDEVVSEDRHLSSESTENHVYNNNGVCANCGHVNTCKHEHPDDYRDFDWSKVSYKVVDNKYHEITGPAYQVVYCNDCDTVLSRTPLGTVTEKHWHNYEDGMCQQCGHKNTCKHGNTRQGYEWDWEHEFSYNDIDNREHQRIGLAHAYTECQDCGMVISRSDTAVSYSQDESHDYANGVCRLCGHKNTCKHENADVFNNFEGADVTYKEVDNLYHTVSGSCYEITYCGDCGTEVKKVPLGKQTAQETHNYGEDGVCWDCWHKNTCKHPSPDTFKSFYHDSATYKSVDNRYHIISGPCDEVNFCPDCEMEISRKDIGNQSEKRDHWYDENGLCRECKHKNTCLHPSPEAYTYWGNDAVYKSVDNKTHKVEGTQWQETWCDDCGTVLKRENLGKQKGEENHNYYNGVCESCGHKNTCAHKHTQKHSYFSSDDSKYTKLNAKTHRVTGTKIEYVFCSDCESTVSEKSLGTKTETERHTYWNEGKCECGATSKAAYIGLNPVQKMGVGDTWKLEASGRTIKGAKTSLGITYSSSDKKVLTVSKKGVLTAKKPGKATITVDGANGTLVELEVQVLKQAKSVKLNKTKKTLTLKKGTDVFFQLKGKFASKTFSVLSFKSSDKKVAKVDKFGIVTAVGEGKATITATNGKGKTAKCVVTVKDPNAPTKIKLKQGTKATLKKGKKLTLKVVYTPAGTTSKLTWKSSNAKVAKVSSKGVVTAKSKGTATITVTTKGGVKAKIKITVK